ncbi:MAG: hypothetical protein HUU20_29535, partial [Pirellulales bacterium]|nr:hypothetical protein [Pirellulales bacterium]
MRIRACLAIVLLGWAATTQAAPVEFQEIPAGAKWLAHVDVDAMRDTTLVPRAYHQVVQEHPEAERHFEKVREISGMDPRQGLHSLTFCGTKISEEQGILIVKGDFDQARLEEKAKDAPDHEVAA